MKKKVYLLILLFTIFLFSCRKKPTNSGNTNGGNNISDTTPPGEVENIKIFSLDSALKLVWENPQDKDFAGILITRREDRYPSSDTTDGNQIYFGLTTTYTDINLTNGKRYYYRIFTFDKSKNFSNGVTISGIPQKKFTENTIPLISNLQVIPIYPLGKVIVKWDPPEEEGNWAYLVNVVNSKGNWEYNTSSTSTTISGVPLTVPDSNNISVQVCLSDHSVCGKEVTKEFSLPEMKQIDRVGVFKSQNVSFKPQFYLAAKLADGVLYNGSNTLLYAKIATTTTDDIFLTLGWGENDTILASEGITDPITNTLFGGIIVAVNEGNNHYLKLVNFISVLDTHQTNFSITLIDENKHNAFTCADFLPVSLRASINTEPHTIYSVGNKLYMANESGEIKPQLIYTSPVTISHCKSFLYPDGTTGIALMDFSYSNKYDYNLKILTIGNANPDYALHLGNISYITLLGGNLQYNNSVTPVVSTIFEDDNNGLANKLYLFNYNGTTWSTEDYSSVSNFSSNYLMDADGNFSPIKTSGTLGILKGELTTSGMSYYILTIPITSGNRGIYIDTSNITTNSLQSPDNSMFPVKISVFSAKDCYILYQFGVQWGSNTTFSYLVRYETQGSNLISHPDQTTINSSIEYYQFLRGQSYYALNGNGDIENFVTGVPHKISLSYPNANEDFSTLSDNKGDYIAYANYNDLYIYSTQSSSDFHATISTGGKIKYITAPDFAASMKAFSLYNVQSGSQAETNLYMIMNSSDNNWNITNIAGNSSNLCNISVIGNYYPIFTTSSDLNEMVLFFWDSNKILNYILWQNKTYYYCHPIGFQIAKDPDNEAVSYYNGKFYLTVSYHDSTTQGTTYLLVFDNNILLKGKFTIADNSTYAVPIPNSRIDPDELILLYYKLTDGKLYWIPFSHCKNNTCTDSYSLFDLNLGNNAAILRPYLYLDESGKPVIEFADKSHSTTEGRAIRIHP